MTRIVAGSAGGRRLRVPPGDTTRPTSDRVREALFSALDAAGAVEDARVLDLYAGSGALGLEAASRGAREVVLVEAARAAAQTARANAAALGLPGVRVEHERAERFLAGPRAADGGGWDLVLVDPPYAVDDEALAAVLAALAPLLADGATVVVERSARSPEPRWPAGWSAARRRRYGETSVWTVHLDGPGG
ncbi:16S rRNA (guanine(966)-N(2))-methyltransferase RsmD [Paenibacillus sp. TRM 82003]|uniref:16S rRNA (guanine(966)-N(2))-methyltransferase RsmD n=1 Tax=Kineococcus sp. TRM81007 TaxID=2925831 RepID=UPI001F55C9BB|nr:16S rRNA (guanine(966)-N(2))-methyltransferase RsmD [Kineococcus sp. TRM81007]MCI2240208.1 16S rRNA (guanine(966)-N(2))-methyltransferase RsmD [Kineococcus sp. TRM81007]MCI3927614.1 16S rRNA (guanine(966)-N(2))-methyltransferase RsmD [Paenibacillus sp. TRM 82003]